MGRGSLVQVVGVVFGLGLVALGCSGNAASDSPGASRTGSAGRASGGSSNSPGVGGGGSSAVGASSAVGGADDPSDEHDRYGSARAALLEMDGPLEGGNVIQMKRAMILRGVAQEVRLIEDQTLTLFVYEADQLNGPYALRWSADVPATGVTQQLVPSPRLSLPLDADKFYWIGLSMPGTGVLDYGFQGVHDFPSSTLVSLHFAMVGILESSFSPDMPLAPINDQPLTQTLDLRPP